MEREMSTFSPLIFGKSWLTAWLNHFITIQVSRVLNQEIRVILYLGSGAVLGIEAPLSSFYMNGWSSASSAVSRCLYTSIVSSSEERLVCPEYILTGNLANTTNNCLKREDVLFLFGTIFSGGLICGRCECVHANEATIGGSLMCLW